MVGNSVCPHVSAAIVRANFADEAVGDVAEGVSA